jgi:hypothetical protein
MPTSIEHAPKIKPPTINISPKRKRNLESITTNSVGSLVNMNSLAEEIKLVEQLIEDMGAEPETPPTEGETSHNQALELLRSIDQGIRTLNTGLQDMADAKNADEPEPETKPEDNAEPVNTEDELPEAPGSARATPRQQASVGSELEKLGVPQR